MIPKPNLSPIKSVIKWFFGFGFYERSKLNPSETFLLTMRVTAKCRFHAANRISWQNKISFLITTLFSLGLIFIPLMQNSTDKIPIHQSVMNMMQVFLAVAILVYSVIISNSQYELRSERLIHCGDSIKNIIRKLSKQIKDNEIDDQMLQKYQEEYANIITKTENPQRVDYIRATLEMGRDYKITGIRRLLSYIHIIFLTSIPYFIPLIMIVSEILFITFMFNISIAPESIKYIISK